MARKIRMFIAGIILTVLILNNTGCAAAWFLAGAGTAATAVIVSEESRKGSTEPDPDN